MRCRGSADQGGARSRQACAGRRTAGHFKTYQINPGGEEQVTGFQMAGELLGMDGWETSYVLRRRHNSQAPIAIVSANAFDKGMDNAAGITADDFIVKPVNIEELLDWIGRRLSLEWVTEAEPPAPSPALAAMTEMVLPPDEQLSALAELVRIGYVRGIKTRLDEIDTLDPCYRAFTDTMRGYAARFQLDVMADFIRKSKDHELQP